MASLTAITSYACQGTQGIITLESVTDAPGAEPGGAYSWTVTNSNGTNYGGTVEAGNNVAVPDGKYDVRVYAAYPGGGDAASSPRSYTVACAGNGGGGGSGGGSGPGPNPSPGPDPGITGCTNQRALNYDPAATKDSTPTACEFVAVALAPGSIVAAHLPIPVRIRASPTVDYLASIVVLYLETSDSTSGPWQEFGRLRQTCDTQANADFNLSEAAKSLLRIGPPVESGTDTQLTALLRVRYEVVDPSTGQPTAAGTLSPCRVLNAVQQASSGATLTSATPYATRPAAAALWASTVSYAGGISTSAVVRPADGCQARQFAWLNAAGAWDTGFFYGRHVHGTDQADAISYRDTAGADRYARRGTVRQTLQVYSDKVDWPTFRLLRGVRDSVQVYERLGPGQYVPVLVPTESYTEYQEVTDKTYQVNFTVSYPAQLIQTQ